MRPVLSAAIIAALLLTTFLSAQDQPAPQRAQLRPPAGARIVSFDNYGFGIVPEFRSVERSASGGHVRLDAAIPVQDIVDHYVSQLSAIGWKTTLRQVDPALGLVRFAVGRDDDPQMGLLTVTPFASTGHIIVAVRLVRSRMPWAVPRRGSGGANERGGAQPANILFFANQPRLTLPEAVLRAERRDGGGQPDIRYAGVRIETFMPVQALWGSIEPQLFNVGWTTTTRLGDQVQNAVRRSSPDGQQAEVLLVTALPATQEIDVALMIACSNERPCSP